MKGNKKTYTVFQLASAIVMILALLWLTVSLPFVYAAQQELAKHTKAATSSPLSLAEEETSSGNTLGNTTEEKKPSGNNNLSEEYLHNHCNDDHFISAISQIHKSENDRIYTAFHGEVHVPPPNIA